MRRLLLLAVLAVLALAAPAAAHPLGNFSINHLDVVRVSTDRVDVRYVLDQAEIPTFQERGLKPAQVLARKRADVARGVTLSVGGRRVPLTLAPGGRISFPMGAGGLRTTRVELLLGARVAADGPVVVRDATFGGRVGWKAVVVGPGRAAAGHGVLLLFLLAAFGWGALHALSPGHGKAMVAAYLVGTRGRSRHALALGLTVTVTHTIGVFALGLVTLALSQYILPEQLYPWLNLASGLLVLGVGAAVLRGRFRRARHHHDHDHHLDHDHDHHHDHGHGHHHHHHAPSELRPRALIAMGISAGLIPCPSALVVLLGAIAQHQIALGLLLICAFSAGLAATLTALGLLVVHAGRLTSRVRTNGRVLAVLPALSSVAIVAVGLVLTAQAVPKLM
jgi:ABC-type nickel/cobalt efflux system permease component RcnA